MEQIDSDRISTKTICITYKASAELSSLFENFKLMCNDAIRIAL